MILSDTKSLRICHHMVFMVVLLLSFTSHTQVIVAKDYDTLSKQVLNEVTPESLVLFDIDGVLLTSAEEFDFRSPIRLNIKKDLRSRYSKSQMEEIFSDFFRKRQVRLVNKNMPKLLDDLRGRKIPFAALTAWWTGSFADLELMEEVKIQELHQVGLSFESDSPFVTPYVFDKFSVDQKYVPMIYKGIILTDLANKGEVLKLVLQQGNTSKFKKVIFIEDTPRHLESVGSICGDFKIDFVGIHYTEENSLPEVRLDPERERQRFKILETEHLWLNDAELSTRGRIND